MGIGPDALLGFFQRKHPTVPHSGILFASEIESNVGSLCALTSWYFRSTGESATAVFSPFSDKTPHISPLDKIPRPTNESTKSVY